MSTRMALFALGMHKRGSFYDLVTVSDCQIVDEGFQDNIKGNT